MNRERFLKSMLGISAFLSMPYTAFKDDDEALLQIIKASSSGIKGSMFGFKDKPIDQVKVGIIGLGHRGFQLLNLFEWFINNGKARVTAFCDLDQNKVDSAKEMLAQWQTSKPATYSGGENEWKKLNERDDIDIVIIATPWELHAPMAIHGMNNGKHVASEVPIAYTLTESCDLVKAAERNSKHCIMMENCCYNEEELFVLNMVQEGVFGDLTHAEGAYLHDLRAHLLTQGHYKNDWRVQHHVERNGNFYTTHGLGPISFYLEIGRGDTFSHLTSMSSRELNLSETASEHGSPYQDIKCGDMNSTMIKTKKGKTILLQFDVHTGRPYSRLNRVTGTGAIHEGYPGRLYIDPGELNFGGHHWLEEKAYASYKEKYKHPLLKKMNTISEEFRKGHGGMDFVMLYRLISCLNNGAPLDINVYDSVLWSVITPLSELSVANHSLTVPVPDYTAGQWEERRKLEIMRREVTK